ncbi:MAG: 6,7-dimethyl-8-ribityllumazine synthase [Bacteroidia bacterium]|nr:6,7-dimethyl-8-ribityllumazine synthase [Bacteroidia bacterium]
MKAKKHNLSESHLSPAEDASGLRFGIVVSSWNSEITESLFRAAVSTLKSAGCPDENIFRTDVPGSFELPLGAKILYEQRKPDAIICLGCVIRGETPHFDYICSAVSAGIMQLNVEKGLPFIFGVLTTENIQQAQDRSGGTHGNKGIEAAVTAIRMALLKAGN